MKEEAGNRESKAARSREASSEGRKEGGKEMTKESHYIANKPFPVPLLLALLPLE